jgi:hypothetical protein
MYAVNMNHMRERHLDGTVLLRQAAGGIFEPLARPDLLITDADRASVMSSRRRDRDAALIGTPMFSNLKHQHADIPSRHHNRDTLVSFITSFTLRFQYTDP